MYPQKFQKSYINIMDAKTKQRLKGNIRGTIQRFVNSRVKAYRFAKQRYQYNMHAGQAKAISAIQEKLSFTENWDFEGTCLMALSLSDHLQMIMPAYSSDPRQATYRTQIEEMMKIASEHITKPQAA